MKDRTVQLGSYNSDDLHIVFTELVNKTPEPKTQIIDIPYGDGSLDLTDYYGTVRYENRTIEMAFFIADGYDQWAVYSDVATKLHGKNVDIIFSADQSYKYNGRLSVGDFSVSDDRWSFSIVATCDPYKTNISTGEKSL